MQTKHLFVIHNRTQSCICHSVIVLMTVLRWSFFCGSLLLVVSLFVCHTVLTVHCSLTCWERANLLTLMWCFLVVCHFLIWCPVSGVVFDYIDSWFSYLLPYNWAATWDFQKCGICDQQSLRSACAYAQSDQNLCLSLEYSMIVKLLTEHHLEFLTLKGGCTGVSESTLV